MELVEQLRAVRDAHLAQQGLSPREQEIAVLLIKGLTLQDIAKGLGLSLATVKQHTSSIYEKAEATGRAEFVSMVFPT